MFLFIRISIYASFCICVFREIGDFLLESSRLSAWCLCCVSGFAVNCICMYCVGLLHTPDCSVRVVLRCIMTSGFCCTLVYGVIPQQQMNFCRKSHSRPNCRPTSLLGEWLITVAYSICSIYCEDHNVLTLHFLQSVDQPTFSNFSTWCGFSMSRNCTIPISLKCPWNKWWTKNPNSHHFLHSYSDKMFCHSAVQKL